MKTLNYHHFATDYSSDPIGQAGNPGCINCSTGAGDGSDIGDLPRLSIDRVYRQRDFWVPGSFGGGHFLKYDVRFRLLPTGETVTESNSDSTQIARIFDPFGDTSHYHILREFSDDANDQVVDGSFHSYLNAYQSVLLYDSEMQRTGKFSDAAWAIATKQDGVTFTFEIITTRPNASNGYTDGRLTRWEDRNGNAITIAYEFPANASNAELGGDFTKLFNYDTITDAYGLQASFDYVYMGKSGQGWVVSAIHLPNGETIDYGYGTNNWRLETVDHPDGSQSTFIPTGIGSENSRYTRVEINDPAAGPGHVRKTLYFNQHSVVVDDGNGGQTVEPQAGFLSRMMVNGDGELGFRHWESLQNKQNISQSSPTEAQTLVHYFYTGGHEILRYEWQADSTNQSFNVKPVSFSYAELPSAPDTLAAVDGGFDPTGLTFTPYIDTVADNRQIITGETDPLGRTQDYVFDVINRDQTEVTHFDSSITKRLFNIFAQPTQIIDRLGRASTNTYDAKGNRLTRTVGLDVDGGGAIIDLDPSDTSTWTWTYNAKGQPVTSTDANGNVTDYSYDASNYLVTITEPADLAAGTRATRTFEWDSAGRLAAATDAEGRRVTYAYDVANRLSVISYFDSSTETFTYGAAGTLEQYIITAQTDRNGNQTTFAYDGTTRLTTTVFAVGTPETVSEVCTYLQGEDLKASCTKRGEKTEWSYDERNRLMSQRSFPNTTTTLETTHVYDVLDRRLITTDPYGRRSLTLFDINDYRSRSVRETTPGGLGTVPNPATDLADYESFVAALPRILTDNAAYLITDYSYDSEQQLTATTDPRGNQMIYSYDQQGRRISATEAAGSSIAALTEIDYDAQGNVTEVRHPRFFDATDTNCFQQCTTTKTYTGRNLTKSETVADGSTVAATRSFSYFLDRRSKTSTDFRGNDWTSLWHICCGRLQASIDPTNSGTVRNTDFYGNVTHTAVASNLPADVTAYNWHNPIDADTTNETTTRYDGLNRPTHTTAWLVPLGFVLDEARANLGNGVIPIAGENGVPATHGLTTRYVYDDNLIDGIGLDATYAADLAGLNLGTGSDGKAIAITNPEGETTVTIYDGLGRTIKTIDGLGDANTITYDIVVTISGFGNVVETTVADALSHANSQRMDGAGRTIESEDAENNITTYSNDANSNRVSFRDPNGVGQDCVFDERNRDLSCTDTQGDITSRTYDHNNNVVTATDGLGSLDACVFDARDRKQSCTDRILATTAYAYDDNNNLLTITDGEGSITTYVYETRNLLNTETFPTGDAGTTHKTYSYDQSRRLTDRVINTAEAPLTLETTIYDYDMANRLTTRGYPEEVTADDTFTYDAASRLLSATSNRYSNTVTRSYDDDSKLITEQLNIDGTDYDISYAYDAADRQTGITYPNGKQVIRSYTDRNQLHDIAYNGNVLSTSSYDAGRRETNRGYGNGINTVKTYRNDNLISSIIASGNTLDLSYTYDANKRKLTETDSLRSSASQTFNYDTEDRLTTWSTDSAETNQNWTLSLVGDWDATVRTGTDPINENRTHTDVHEVTAIGANALTYDFKGNLATNGGNFQDNAWDAENRMKSIGDSVDADYRYDALGRRVQKSVTDNAVTTITTFVCGGAQVFTEYVGSVEKQSYVYASYVDDPVALIKATGDTSFYHQNHLFSTEVITDNTGAVVETVDYNSYGKTTVRDFLNNIIASSSVGNPYYFTGRRLDSESGLYYFRARYFDVELGRFIARDPLKYVDGFGLYGGYFVPGATDPTGMSECKGGSYRIRFRKTVVGKCDRGAANSHVAQRISNALIGTDGACRGSCDDPKDTCTWGGAFSSDDKVRRTDVPAGNVDGVDQYRCNISGSIKITYRCSCVCIENK